MNEALKNEILQEMEAAGFVNVRNSNSSEFQLYAMVYNGVIAVLDLGRHYWEKSTVAGPKIKHIVLKLAAKYEPK